MSTREVNPFAVSSEISSLGLWMGKIEGQAKERGYPLLPDAKLVDCGQLVLSAFEKHKGLLAQMQGELDTIYSKLRVITTDLEGIKIPELKEVFEAQIKELHEKRGVLNHSFSAFGRLLSFHALIEEIKTGVVSVQNRVALFESGKLGIEDWEAINHSVEDLLLRLRIAFPEGDNACKLHESSKIEMRDTLMRCQLFLNLKKGEFKKQSFENCKVVLSDLLLILDGATRTKISDQNIEKAQELFGRLPLDLRAFIFGGRQLLTEDQETNIATVFSRSGLDLVSQAWIDKSGFSYYDSQRNLERFEASVEKVVAELGLSRSTLLGEREKAKSSLDSFVTRLPEEEIRNPQSLLVVLAQICVQNPSLAPLTPASHGVLAPYEKGLKALNEKEFDLVLQDVPVLSSLRSIKEQVEMYRTIQSYSALQKELLVAALLGVAEGKGGVSFNAENGVYYWIWFLANQKDPSAGGDNFGKTEAPKDLDRLLEALEKAMPPEPVVTPPKALSQTPPSSPSLQNAKLDESQFDVRLQSVPVLKSLKEIKDQVEAYKEARIYHPEQRERLVAALLEAAADKGGVSLDAENGVYYWIWFLAHEKDSSAGGDDFGKVHAPKDLDRLLEALKRAMPIEQAPVLTPSQMTPTGGVKIFPSNSPKVTTRVAQMSPASRVQAKVKAQEVKREIENAPVFQGIKVKYQVPQGRSLWIRGQGGGLSWTKGKPLHKINDSTYVYSTKGFSGNIEYKILIDDRKYEEGNNRSIEVNKVEEFTPVFPAGKIVATIDFAPEDGKLFVCGTGPGMSWDENQKLELKQVDGKYVIELEEETSNFEFKVLLSSNKWSEGDNFKVQKGKLLQVKPKF